MPEETGVQLLCAASYDIKWRRNLDTDKASTEQICDRTDQNGKKYAQHQTQGQKDQHPGQGEDKRHRHNQQCEKNEEALSRAHQPPQIRPMDLACHHMETIRQEKTTTETSRTVERRPGQIPKGHDLADDSTREANLEAQTTGHYSCPMTTTTTTTTTTDTMMKSHEYWSQC